MQRTQQAFAEADDLTSTLRLSNSIRLSIRSYHAADNRLAKQGERGSNVSTHEKVHFTL